MPTVNDPDGTAQHVDNENRALTSTISDTKEHHANIHEQAAYSWYFTDDPDASDDCIFYIKNNDDKDLILEGIDLFITDECTVYFNLGGTGTINSSATTVTGANLTAGSGNKADATAAHDGDIESGGTFSGSTTGFRYKFITGTTVDTKHFNFPMDVVIPKNQVFTIWVDTISIVVNGTLYGFFHVK